MDLTQRIGRSLMILGEKLARGTSDPRSNAADRALASFHPTAVLYPTASLQPLGHPATDIAVGANSHIRGELLLFSHGGRITIGEYCYVGEQTRIWSSTSIRIGNRVLIAHCCTIMDNLTHPLDPVERHRHFAAIATSGHPTTLDLGEAPVVVEDDAWISCHSIILRGVTVGRGAIVGAGSVVTQDVPSFTIVAGNPARVIREVPINER